MDKTLLITRIIRPVVKVLVKLGCNFNLVKTIIQTEYVYEARASFKNNQCRISTKTGIDRRIVKKILESQSLWMPTSGVDLVSEKLSEVEDEEFISIETFKSIVKAVANGRYTYDTILKELVETKRISISGNKICFITQSLKGNISDDKFSRLLCESIELCTDSLWYLKSNRDLFYWSDFSRQIHPSDNLEANRALKMLAQCHRKENIDALKSFESSDERIHPKIGLLQVQYNQMLTNKKGINQ